MYRQNYIPTRRSRWPAIICIVLAAVIGVLLAGPSFAQQAEDRKTSICSALLDESANDSGAAAAFRAYCRPPAPASEAAGQAQARAQVCGDLRRRAIAGDRNARFEFSAAAKSGIC